jgi:hypothetical protein
LIRKIAMHRRGRIPAVAQRQIGLDGDDPAQPPQQ